MKTMVSLETKDVRAIIASFLGIPIESVIPNRYSFSVIGVSVDEIKNKMPQNIDTAKE